MDTLQEEIEKAKDHLARLERKQKSEDCRKVGCDMQFAGGKNASCDLGDACDCSVPVYSCTKCGDSDYGDNLEATKTREECQKGNPSWEMPMLGPEE
jgi:hypothetical protein